MKEKKYQKKCLNERKFVGLESLIKSHEQMKNKLQYMDLLVGYVMYVNDLMYIYIFT